MAQPSDQGGRASQRAPPRTWTKGSDRACGRPGEHLRHGVGITLAAGPCHTATESIRTRRHDGASGHRRLALSPTPSHAPGVDGRDSGSCDPTHHVRKRRRGSAGAVPPEVQRSVRPPGASPGSWLRRLLRLVGCWGGSRALTRAAEASCGGGGGGGAARTAAAAAAAAAPAARPSRAGTRGAESGLPRPLPAIRQGARDVTKGCPQRRCSARGRKFVWTRRRRAGARAALVAGRASSSGRRARRKQRGIDARGCATHAVRARPLRNGRLRRLTCLRAAPANGRRRDATPPLGRSWRCRRCHVYSVSHGPAQRCHVHVNKDVQSMRIRRAGGGAESARFDSRGIVIPVRSCNFYKRMKCHW